MNPPSDRTRALALVSIATLFGAGCDSVVGPEAEARAAPDERLAEPVAIPVQAVLVLDDIATRLLPPLGAGDVTPMSEGADLRARIRALRTAIERLESEPGTADSADLDAMRLALDFLESLESPRP